jgi:hypothetical protein
VLGSLVALASGCTTQPAASTTTPPTPVAAVSPSPSAMPSPAAATTPAAASPGRSFSLPSPVASPFAPDLEARLPAELRGIPMQRVSTPLSNLAGGSDMCIILCSHEPGRLASASGMDMEDLRFAIALPPDDSGLAVQIVAIQFPGLATDRLIPVRLEAGGHSGPPENDPPPRVTELVAGSETVTLVEWAWWFPEAGQGEYLYARDDILYLISGLVPEDGHAPADVTLAVEALARL